VLNEYTQEILSFLTFWIAVALLAIIINRFSVFAYSEQFNEL
jgi:hypothetical protein